MPEYHYACRECDNEFSIVESIKADAQTLCPSCNHESLFRVIYAPHVSVKGDIKTVGQLAEHNWKKLGKVRQEEKAAQDNIKETIERRERKAKLNKIGNMTAEQKIKYIENGD